MDFRILHGTREFVDLSRSTPNCKSDAISGAKWWLVRGPLRVHEPNFRGRTKWRKRVDGPRRRAFQREKQGFDWPSPGSKDWCPARPSRAAATRSRSPNTRIPDAINRE